MRWHSRGGRSLFLANSVTPSRVAGGNATIVSQPMPGAFARSWRCGQAMASTVHIRKGSRYPPPPDASDSAESEELSRDLAARARALGGRDLCRLLVRLPSRRYVIDILLLAVILAASAAAGLLVLRLLDARPHATHGNELLVLGLAIGLGLTSVIGLALAAVGALRPWPIAVAGAIALLAGGRDLVRVLADVRLPRRPEAWLLVAVCVLLLVAESPTWFAPPVGGDQTKYQLAYPRIYAQAGGLVATPWTFWGAQQWLQNFLFALAYALRGEDLARLLNATSGVLAALAVAVLVRRHFDRRLGVVAGTLF